MADISTYIEQIQSATYGEEVRSSIINALEKVNDDNESYQSIKDEVVAAKDSVEETVAEFETTLADTIEKAEDAGTALEEDTEAARQTDAALLESVGLAQGTDKTLIQTINDADAANTTLTETIEKAEDADTALNKTISEAEDATADAQEATEALTEAADTVAKEETAKAIETLLEGIAELTEQLAEKADQTDGFSFLLNDDGSVGLSYTDPDTGEEESAVLPTETTLTNISDTLDGINDSLGIILAAS